jgi:hypothetical protein
VDLANIPLHITAKQIYSVFAVHGMVNYVMIFPTRKSGLPAANTGDFGNRRCGAVIMASKQDAQTAASKVHQTTVKSNIVYARAGVLPIMQWAGALPIPGYSVRFSVSG